MSLTWQIRWKLPRPCNAPYLCLLKFIKLFNPTTYFLLQCLYDASRASSYVCVFLCNWHCLSSTIFRWHWSNRVVFLVCFCFCFILFIYFRYCLYIPSNMFLLKLKDNWLIIWLSNILALGVPDEGYSRNASCALNLISTVLLRQLSVFLLRTYIGIPGLRPLLFLSNQLNKMTIAIYNYKRLDS